MSNASLYEFKSKQPNSTSWLEKTFLEQVYLDLLLFLTNTRYGDTSKQGRFSKIDDFIIDPLLGILNALAYQCRLIVLLPYLSAS